MGTTVMDRAKCASLAMSLERQIKRLPSGNTKDMLEKALVNVGRNVDWSKFNNVIL